jgi:5-methylcytosine-specific restriction protein A
MPRKPCLECGVLHSNSSRCDACESKWQSANNRRRGSSTARGYDAKWRRLAAVYIQQYRMQHGDWCQGYRVPAHLSSDLTVDHIVPKAAGGKAELSNMGVLCRGCNGRKRDH